MDISQTKASLMQYAYAGKSKNMSETEIQYFTDLRRCRKHSLPNQSTSLTEAKSGMTEGVIKNEVNKATCFGH